jgi:HAD superfamily hydrolase (TIGR01509 family)
MATKLKAILFDIDGVLADSEDAQITAFVRLFERHGFPGISKQFISSLFGMTSHQIIEKVAGRQPEEKVNAMLRDIHLLSLEVIPLMRAPPVHSIIPLLAKKYSLGVITNRTRTARPVLEHFGIAKYFSCVITPIDGKAKPSPDLLLVALQKTGASAQEAIYFGDTAVDEGAGIAAGVRTVIVGPQTPASFYLKEIEK